MKSAFFVCQLHGLFLTGSPRCCRLLKIKRIRRPLSKISFFTGYSLIPHSLSHSLTPGPCNGGLQDLILVVEAQLLLDVSGHEDEGTTLPLLEARGVVRRLVSLQSVQQCDANHGSCGGRQLQSISAPVQWLH